jgi:hypothetical protein
MPVIDLFNLGIYSGDPKERYSKYIDRENVVGIPRMAFGILGIGSYNTQIFVNGEKMMNTENLNAIEIRTIDPRWPVELAEDLQMMQGISIDTPAMVSVDNSETSSRNELVNQIRYLEGVLHSPISQAYNSQSDSSQPSSSQSASNSVISEGDFLYMNDSGELSTIHPNSLSAFVGISSGISGTVSDSNNTHYYHVSMIA